MHSLKNWHRTTVAVQRKLCCYNLVSTILLLPQKDQKQQQRAVSTTNVVLSQNHYSILGLTPKATQTDVKSAYYKMSKIYHPDKNKGCADAADKFRAITSAYEVLSSYRLRRLYDKGKSQTVHFESFLIYFCTQVLSTRLDHNTLNNQWTHQFNKVMSKMIHKQSSTNDT